MYTIEQKFRASYTGEDVTTLLQFEDGQQPPQTEWVANSVFNNYVTTQAVVIGGGETALKNNASLLIKIKNHKGGLLAANKLQTYGTNDTWKYIPCDFLVAISDANVKPIIDDGYYNGKIVYTNANMVLKYPGKMYLTPQDPPWNSGAIAAYLAAFDGHSKVFLLGFEADKGEEFPFWVKAAQIVFDTYPDTEFVYITDSSDGEMPGSWKNSDNVRHITLREFVLEADIG